MCICVYALFIFAKVFYTGARICEWVKSCRTGTEILQDHIMGDQSMDQSLTCKKQISYNAASILRMISITDAGFLAGFLNDNRRI